MSVEVQEIELPSFIDGCGAEPQKRQSADRHIVQQGQKIIIYDPNSYEMESLKPYLKKLWCEEIFCFAP